MESYIVPYQDWDRGAKHSESQRRLGGITRWRPWPQNAGDPTGTGSSKGAGGERDQVWVRPPRMQHQPPAVPPASLLVPSRLRAAPYWRKWRVSPSGHWLGQTWLGEPGEPYICSPTMGAWGEEGWLPLSLHLEAQVENPEGNHGNTLVPLRRWKKATRGWLTSRQQRVITWTAAPYSPSSRGPQGGSRPSLTGHLCLGHPTLGFTHHPILWASWANKDRVWPFFWGKWAEITGHLSTTISEKRENIENGSDDIRNKNMWTDHKFKIHLINVFPAPRVTFGKIY